MSADTAKLIATARRHSKSDLELALADALEEAVRERDTFAEQDEQETRSHHETLDMLDATLARADAAEAQRDTLARAVDALDLSDFYTFAKPGELVSCTRPIERWRELRAALAAVEPPEEQP